MERVGLDVLGQFLQTELGSHYVLIVMDYFTKWPEVYAVAEQSATTVADKLVEDFFCRFGASEELHSDQGWNFETQVFGERCLQLGIHKTCTTPLHPQSNRQMEHFKRMLATQLPILVAEHQQDWDRHLVIPHRRPGKQPEHASGIDVGV